MAFLSVLIPFRTEAGAFCDECSQPGKECWCWNDGYEPDDDDDSF